MVYDGCFGARECAECLWFWCFVVLDFGLLYAMLPCNNVDRWSFVCFCYYFLCCDSLVVLVIMFENLSGVGGLSFFEVYFEFR